MALFAALCRPVESRLYKTGITLPTVRRLLSIQILVAGTALLVGAPLAGITLWPLLFGTGAAIAAFSLWQITRFAQAHLQQQFSLALGVRLLLGFTIKLAVLSIVLFVLIVQLGAPVVPLLLGLTTTVAGIAIWGIAGLSRKNVKEA